MKLGIMSIALPAVMLSTSALAQDTNQLTIGNSKIAATEQAYNGPMYAMNTNEKPATVFETSTPKNTEDGVIARAYGNNIVSFAPLQITEGVGVGLSYERILDKKGVVSLYLPFAVSFTAFNNDPFVSTTPNNNYRPSFYAMPGLKFYPAGSDHRFGYAVGPNLVYIKGEEFRNELIYDNFGNIIGQDVGWRDRSTFGILVNNSLNVNATQHLHLGLELGLGFSYINKVGDYTTDPIGIAQFNFNIGYRF